MSHLKKPFNPFHELSHQLTESGFMKCIFFQLSPDIKRGCSIIKQIKAIVLIGSHGDDRRVAGALVRRYNVKYLYWVFRGA